MRVVTRIIAVLAVLTSMFVVTGCSCARVAKVGDTVTAGPWELKVEESVTMRDFEGSRAETGSVWLVSRAVARNASAATETLEPGMFSAGKGKDEWAGTTTLKGLTGAQKIPPGGYANVLSAFQVPKDLEGILLRIESPAGNAEVLLN